MSSLDDNAAHTLIRSTERVGEFIITLKHIDLSVQISTNINKDGWLNNMSQIYNIP